MEIKEIWLRSGDDRVSSDPFPDNRARCGKSARRVKYDRSAVVAPRVALRSTVLEAEHAASECEGWTSNGGEDAALAASRGRLDCRTCRLQSHDLELNCAVRRYIFCRKSNM